MGDCLGRMWLVCFCWGWGKHGSVGQIFLWSVFGRTFVVVFFAVGLVWPLGTIPNRLWWFLVFGIFVFYWRLFVCNFDMLGWHCWGGG